MDSRELLNDIAKRLDDGGSSDLWASGAPPLHAIYFSLIREQMGHGGIYGPQVHKDGREGVKILSYVDIWIYFFFV